MLSWPPATTMSASPGRDLLGLKAIALNPNHTPGFTPQAVFSTGTPAATAACRARVHALARREGRSPMMTSSTSAGSTLGALKRRPDGDLAKRSAPAGSKARH